MLTPDRVLTYLTLQRGKEELDRTHGVLMNYGELICYTLERTWEDNQPDVSCIPPGTYHCIKHSSEKFPDVWEITGVEGRKAILIHAGNTVADTHGCVLVGLGLMQGGITKSQAALSKLRKMLPGEFMLEIRGFEVS